MIAKWGLDANPDVAQAAQSAFTTMSERDRAKTILTFAASTSSKQVNSETRVEEEGDDFLYKANAATYCFGRNSDTPVCHPVVGFLAGLVARATGNNEWKVEETGCMAMGEPLCIFQISKRS